MQLDLHFGLGTQMSFSRQLVSPPSDTDLLPAHQNSPLSARLLLAPLGFENDVCNGRRVMDLVVYSLLLELEVAFLESIYRPRSSRSGDVKYEGLRSRYSFRRFLIRI